MLVRSRRATRSVITRRRSAFFVGPEAGEGDGEERTHFIEVTFNHGHVEMSAPAQHVPRDLVFDHHAGKKWPARNRGVELVDDLVDQLIDVGKQALIVAED